MEGSDSARCPGTDLVLRYGIKVGEPSKDEIDLVQIKSGQTMNVQTPVLQALDRHHARLVGDSLIIRIHATPAWRVRDRGLGTNEQTNQPFLHKL